MPLRFGGGAAGKGSMKDVETTRAAIEVEGVGKRFGQGERAVDALIDVSVTIRENEFFTLLGPSGCGKTTLLRLIAGFEHPTAGAIRLHGEEIAHLPPFKRPVNTVFQSYALFPHMTVAKNIGFGLEMLGRPKAEVERTVAEMLRLVRMEELAPRLTSEISGGQQQRVALARALAPRPKVLLLDEPLSALDYKLRKDMQIELKRLQHETGITFVFVTHDQEEALTMSDRIAVMSRGRILQVGSPRDIYDHPDERFVADFIGDTNFLTGELVAINGRSAQVRLDAGTELAARLPDRMEPSPGRRVTAAIRPEHARLVPEAEGVLAGTVETVVYFGTDSNYHLTLSDGARFTARLQNTASGMRDAEQGDRVGLAIAPDSVQVLRD
jgi:spermidine/putrescine transport system ATP-binding protein